MTAAQPAKPARPSKPGKPGVPALPIEIKASADATARSAYRKALKDAGIHPADLPVLTAIMVEAMKMPANRRKMDCRNRILKRYGKDDGTKLYWEIRDIVHSFAEKGPWPGTADGETIRLDISSEILTHIFQAARRTMNPAQSLKDQLMSYCETKEDAEQAAKKLKKYL